MPHQRRKRAFVESSGGDSTAAFENDALSGKQQSVDTFREHFESEVLSEALVDELHQREPRKEHKSLSFDFGPATFVPLSPAASEPQRIVTAEFADPERLQTHYRMKRTLATNFSKLLRGGDLETELFSVINNYNDLYF